MNDREVLRDHLNNEAVYVFKSGMVAGAFYLQGDTSGSSHTLSVQALLQALHNLGLDVQGWKPEPTLRELVEDLLIRTLNVRQAERAEQLIELIQGYKP